MLELPLCHARVCSPDVVVLRSCDQGVACTVYCGCTGLAAATSVCFAEKAVITAPVLKTAIQQILNMSPLPVILMRTVSVIPPLHKCEAFHLTPSLPPPTQRCVCRSCSPSACIPPCLTLCSMCWNSSLRSRSAPKCIMFVYSSVG